MFVYNSHNREGIFKRKIFLFRPFNFELIFLKEFSNKQELENREYGAGERHRFICVFPFSLSNRRIGVFGLFPGSFLGCILFFTNIFTKYIFLFTDESKGQGVSERDN